MKMKTSKSKVKLTDKSPEFLNEMFAKVLASDQAKSGFSDSLSRWLFADRLKERGVRGEMGFSAFEGPPHIKKFFAWLRSANLPDSFSSEYIDELVTSSILNDQKVFRAYGLGDFQDAIANMARYNAQDFAFQRLYPMPARCAINTILDFGAGHGRMANLTLLGPAENSRAKTYIAVEGIPSTYFTQYFYWDALGLKIWDYFEHVDEEISAEVFSNILLDYDVVHLPTWRTDLVPNGCVDLVVCVQVLKELPGELVAHIIPEFSRVLHSSGAIYIRDHLQFHNPNHMPIDLLVQSNGFTLEFAPQLVDRKEIHGLPRIWRKVNARNYLK